MNTYSFVLWESAQAEPIASRIAIAGDFLPAGGITLPTGGWRAAAAGLADHFSDISTSFVNLECAVDSESLPGRPIFGLGQLVSAPGDSLDYLREIRSLAVGIANNHSYDFCEDGVSRTRTQLAQRGLVPLGAGRNLSEPPEVFVWQGPNDTRVGFWAAATASRDLATGKSPGVEPATIARAAQAAAALKSRGAQFSIALLHAGCIRTCRPEPGEARLMDGIASRGFNLVAASHSHRISGAKLLPGLQGVPSLVFYGLGSIASGYVASLEEREGLIIVVGLNRHAELTRVELRPVILAESGFGEIPSLEIAEGIFQRFRGLSREIADGSSKHLFYGDMSPGLIELYIRDARAAFRQAGIRGLARKAARMRMSHVRRLVHRMIA